MLKKIIYLLIIVIIVFVSIPYIKPKIAIILNNQGMNQYKNNNIDKAVYYLEKSLDFEKNSSTYMNLAKIYHEKKELKKAESIYRKIIDVDKDNLSAHLALTDLYIKNSQYINAIDHLEKYHHVSPKIMDKKIDSILIMIYNKACFFYEIQDYNQALSTTKEILGIDKNFGLAYQLQAKIFRKQNNIIKAIERYKLAVSKNIVNPTIYNNIGLCYMRLEQYSQAIEYLKKAYNLDPKNVNILYNIASTLRDTKDFGQALIYYKKLLTLEYDYPNLHNEIAEIYKSLNKDKEAEKEYLNEVDISINKLKAEPKNVPILINLAKAYNGLKEYQKAKKTINTALKLNPQSGEALYTAGLIHKNTEETYKAKAYFNKAKKYFIESDFIENHIASLQKKEEDSNAEYDTVVYLKNGKAFKGKFTRKTKDQIYLKMFYDNAPMIFGIKLNEIKKIEKF